MLSKLKTGALWVGAWAAYPFVLLGGAIVVGVVLLLDRDEEL